MVGKRYAPSSALSKPVERVDVTQPTAASELLLDEAFGELNEGQPKKAFHAFEKIQQLQPSLAGIHYLIGYAAQSAGESSIAAEALQRSLDRLEMVDESRLLLAVIHLSQSGSGKAEGAHLSDPLTDAESEFRNFTASHPVDAGVYYQWAEALRSQGSYLTAAQLLHKGTLRSSITANSAFLTAKEVLTRLQAEPAKDPPSLSGITSMSGESALGAALGSLQTKKPSEALIFLERAREFYSPSVFRELMKDHAFDPYRTDPKLRGFLTTDQ